MPRRRLALSRRSFISRVSASAAIALAPLGAHSQPNHDPAAISDLASRVSGIFGDLDAPATIGARYLELYRDQDSNWIPALLRSDLLALRAERLRSEIARRIRRDFSRKDIALVDGWVLSRTEARLCALMSLASSSPA